MKSTPILYSAPMVTAIRRLKNPKTQTRRTINPQPGSHITRLYALDNADFSAPTDQWAMEYLNNGRPWTDGGKTGTITCPYGTLGDQLWGKETFFDVSPHADDQQFAAVTGNYIYRADYAYRDKDRKIIGSHQWKPSIFMPNVASRIRQQLTAVRAQRLQDITEQDSLAEGADSMILGTDGIWYVAGPARCGTYRKGYQWLWNSINLKPSPIYSRDPETSAKYISAYESYPWSLEDFERAYPRAILSDPHGSKPQSYHGKPLTIIPNPWVWAITFTNL